MSREQRIFGITDSLKAIYTAWKPHWIFGIAILGLIGIQQGFVSALAASLKLIIDLLVNRSNESSLELIITLLVIGFVLAAAATVSKDYIRSIAFSRIMNDFRTKMYNHFQKMPMSYYNQTKPGDTLAYFSTDLEQLQNVITYQTAAIAFASVGIVINMTMIFILDWRLALLCLIVVPVIIFSSKWLSPIASTATYETKSSVANMLNAVHENIQAQPVIKANSLQQQFKDDFAAKLDDIAKKNTRSQFLSTSIGTIANLSIQLLQLLITILGAFLVYKEFLTAGTLVAFLAVLALVTKSALTLTKTQLPGLIEAAGGLMRLNQLFSQKGETDTPQKQSKVKKLNNSIGFHQISFGYQPNNINLDRVSLEVKAGQNVAFVGESGSGKSTILNLIMKFYEPQKGKITFDGKAFSAIKSKALHNQMGIVLQSNHLFQASILDNIRITVPGASKKAVEEAAKLAEIHKYIITLPKGYQTIVGEGGASLSGGQIQRIAIARALLKNPNILILDEATSALDPTTESQINQTLKKLSKGRTVLQVTHRLSSISHVDNIFVLQTGQVIESGSYKSLIKQQGKFYQLQGKQSGFEMDSTGKHASISAERLQKISMFKNVSIDYLNSLTKQFVSSQFKENETIFKQGDAGNCFYILVRGKVGIYQQDTEQPIAKLTDGDFFGEMALINDSPRNATVVALMPCLTISLYRDQFEALLKDEPSTLALIQSVASKRCTASSGSNEC